MNIDPNLTRLQNLIEQKRAENTLSSKNMLVHVNNGALDKSETAKIQGNSGVKPSNELLQDKLLSLKNISVKDMEKAIEVNRAEKENNLNSVLLHTREGFNINNEGLKDRIDNSTAHIGQFVDIYA